MVTFVFLSSRWQCSSVADLASALNQIQSAGKARTRVVQPLWTFCPIARRGADVAFSYLNGEQLNLRLLKACDAASDNKQHSPRVN